MCSVKYRPEALASAHSGRCGTTPESRNIGMDFLELAFKVFGYVVQIISNSGVLS